MNRRSPAFKDKVYHIIKEQILEKKYDFGERLNVDTLSKELNVSNNPIREALTMLERDGLVVLTPNVGAKVISFTSKSFRELTQTIVVLETGAYQLCIYNNKLNILIELMEKALANQIEIIKKDVSYSDYARAALAFDETVIRATGNDNLIRIFESQIDLFFLAMIYDYTHRERDQGANIDEHIEILRATKNGNHRLVQNLITDHFAREIPPKKNLFNK